MGIKELAIVKNIPEIVKEAQNRWKNYEALLIMSLVALFLMFMPMLSLAILIGIVIFSLILLVRIMQLMKQCKNKFI